MVGRAAERDGKTEPRQCGQDGVEQGGVFDRYQTSNFLSSNINRLCGREGTPWHPSKSLGRG